MFIDYEPPPPAQEKIWKYATVTMNTVACSNRRATKHGLATDFTRSLWKWRDTIAVVSIIRRDGRLNLSLIGGAARCSPFSTVRFRGRRRAEHASANRENRGLASVGI